MQREHRIKTLTSLNNLKMSKDWSSFAHIPSPWLTEVSLLSVPCSLSLSFSSWPRHDLGPGVTNQRQSQPSHNNNTHLHTSYLTPPRVHMEPLTNKSQHGSCLWKCLKLNGRPKNIFGSTSSKSIMLSKLLMFSLFSISLCYLAAHSIPHNPSCHDPGPDNPMVIPFREK